MTDRARFRQADVTRALKGAVAAGFVEPRLILHPDGTIELVTGAITSDAKTDDEWADLR